MINIQWQFIYSDHIEIIKLVMFKEMKIIIQEFFENCNYSLQTKKF